MTTEEKLWLEERFRRLENLQMSYSVLRIEIAAEILARLDCLLKPQDLKIATAAHVQFLESRAEQIRELVRQINIQENPAPPPPDRLN